MPNTTWPEVWEAYRALEEERWRGHYTSRGFDTWSAWRREYITEFGLETRMWRLETIANPIESVPGYFVGAYKGWQHYYPEGKTIATFQELVQQSALQENTGVQYWLEHPPEKTRLMLFRCGDDIVVRDGTHRCAAIALCAAKGLTIASDVEAAIAEFKETERDLFMRSIDQQFAKHVYPH